MLVFDGIIFTLQGHGGISVYFRELYNRGMLAGLGLGMLLFDAQAVSRLGGDYPHVVSLTESRIAERYRSCLVPASTELFHSSYYRLPASKKIPSITTVHDFTYERFQSGSKRWVHSWQKFQAIRGAAAVICVSENTRQDLFEFLPEVAKDKVHVVHNGVGASFFPSGVPAGPGRQPAYVIFVGSRVWYKNFSAAADAVALLPGVELACVGGGAFTKAELLYLERRLPGRFRHEGTVSDGRLNDLYGGALCLLYPSSYEGFGIPVIEAMRAGCPVVALSASSIPEVAGEAAVLLESPEPDLLAQAVRRLVDPGFRAGIREKGFVQARSFSWDRTFDQTLAIYEKVLGHSLPRTVA